MNSTILSKDSQELEILLKSENRSYDCQAILKNHCLPSNLLVFFQNFADVYDCLQDKLSIA